MAARRRPAKLYPKFIAGPETNPFESWTNEKWGVKIEDKIPEYQWELNGFTGTVPESGCDKFTHMKQAMELMWPASVWHDWRERRFKAFCDEKNWIKVGPKRILVLEWVGCGSAAKTYDSGLLALFWWLLDPANSRVILTSTTKDAIRSRIWPVVQGLWNDFKRVHLDPVGGSGPHLISSQTILESEKGDELGAIYAQAVKDGETAKAVENLKGRHRDRMMLVVDEAVATPVAIYETVSNILKGAREVVLLFIANAPQTKTDPFSRLCEPRLGWASVGPESLEWESKGSSEWQIPKGLCQHFSGVDSPNVKAGRTIFPFLYHYEDWVRVQQIPDFRRVKNVWFQDFGFWPPADLLTTILTVDLIDRMGARGAFQFQTWRKMIAGLDPAFGGDDCVFVWGAIGDLPGGKLGIQIAGWTTIPVLIDAKDSDGKPLPGEYQIAYAVRDHCNKLGIKPECLAVESTGTGRGVASVLTVEWGQVIRVESGGAPTEDPVANADLRPAKEVYDRRITQLCFQVVNVVEAGLLRGLFEEAVFEFTTRTYDDDGRKKSVEDKEELKKRLGRSPDHADAICSLVEAARLNGVNVTGPEVRQPEPDIEEEPFTEEEEPNSQTHDSFEMFREYDNELV